MSKAEIALAERLIQESTKHNDADTAVKLIAELASYGTEQGQNIQALSMIKRLSPEGKLLLLERQAQKANKMNSLDSESKKKIKTLQKEIDALKQSAKDGLGEFGVTKSTNLDDAEEILEKELTEFKDVENPTPQQRNKHNNLKKKQAGIAEAKKAIYELESKLKELETPIKLSLEAKSRILNSKSMEELNDAYDDAITEIAGQIKASWSDKANACRYLGMLGNLRTHLRNISGNMTMGAVTLSKNIVKTVLEKGASVFDKNLERTTTIAANKESKAFAKADFNNMRDVITAGGKKNPMTQIRDRMKVFNFKPLEKVRKFNFDMLENEDGFFLKNAYVSALSKYMTANKFSPEFLNGNTAAGEAALQRARDYAVSEAKKATFRDASAVADFLSNTISIKNTDNVGVKALKTVAEGVLPFKKTPVNVVRRGIEYSPISVGTAIYKLAKGSPGEAIDDLAKAVTGTALMTLGMFFGSLEIVRTKNNDKTNIFDVQEGEQNYSLCINGKSYSLDSLMPAAMPLLVGVEAVNVLSDNDKTVADFLEAFGRISDPIVENSLLNGLDDMLSGIKHGDSGLGTILFNGMESYASQYRPSILRQTAQAIDPTVRTTYTPKNSPITKGVENHLRSFAAALPYASTFIEPKIDVWGNEVKRDENIGKRAVQALALPWNERTIVKDPVNDELRRLYNGDSERAVLPQNADKSVSYKDKTYVIDSKKYTEYAKTKGRTAKEILDELIKEAEYKSLSDDKKATIIENIYAYANYTAKKEFLMSNGIKYTSDNYKKIEKARSNGINEVDFYTANAYLSPNDDDLAREYYMKLLTPEQKKFVSTTPIEESKAYLKRLAIAKRSDWTAKEKAMYDDLFVGERKNKVDYSDESDVILSGIDASHNAKYDFAQRVGISAEQYAKSYYAQKDITSGYDTHYLSKARKKKAEIDKSFPNATLKQRHVLYESFGISKKVW